MNKDYNTLDTEAVNHIEVTSSDMPWMNFVPDKEI